jgi:hypothetical protein
MQEPTNASFDLIAEVFKQASTQVLQEFVDELDEHPIFRSFSTKDQREFRRFAQLKLAKRQDSIVSRWVRAGGRVDYDDECRFLLLGTPEFARNVMHGLGLEI